MDGIHGGADLRPHLHLMQRMAEEPALRSVYAPAYHVVGAWLLPLAGLAGTPRLLAFGAAAALIAGFRSFQRNAGLPDAAAAVFAWSPYTFALTWCVPKVEAAGYALAFAALGWLLRRRRALVAVALAATFAVHTAAALFLGLAGGVLALATRDRAALLALLAGTALAAPLFGAHLAAGCSLAEALLLSRGDYLRGAGGGSSASFAGPIAVLAGPVALACAAAGARALWRQRRPVALLCAAVLVLYANELWLAPLGVGTTLNLLRGLTLLAFATAAAAGFPLAQRPRLAVWALLGCAAWSLVAASWALPRACFVTRIGAAAVADTEVDRCTFRWRSAAPPTARAPRGRGPS